MHPPRVWTFAALRLHCLLRQSSAARRLRAVREPMENTQLLKLGAAVLIAAYASPAAVIEAACAGDLHAARAPISGLERLELGEIETLTSPPLFHLLRLGRRIRLG